METPPSPPLLYEMMRSFVSLATTLNLSHTVRALNSTRQTVRRHIATLEDHKGGPLFLIEDRKYHLTPLGEYALPGATELILRSDAWLGGMSSHVNGLLHLNLNLTPEHPYHLQQHSLQHMWTGSSPLLQEAFRTWARADGLIDSDSYAPIRPWLMVFRRHAQEWICVDVGDKSSYATWFGWAKQRSSIGRPITLLPGGDDFGRLLTVPFGDVLTTGGARLDHIHTYVPRIENNETVALVPISYQRLLTACRFPDGSFALASLVDRTFNLEIEGVSDSEVRHMAPDLVMDVDIHADLPAPKTDRP